MASPVEAIDLLDPAQGAAAKSSSKSPLKKKLRFGGSAAEWDGFMAYLDTIPALGDEDATTLTHAYAYEQAAAADDA